MCLIKERIRMFLSWQCTTIKPCGTQLTRMLYMSTSTKLSILSERGTVKHYYTHHAMREAGREPFAEPSRHEGCKWSMMLLIIYTVHWLHIQIISVQWSRSDYMIIYDGICLTHKFIAVRGKVAANRIHGNVSTIKCTTTDCCRILISSFYFKLL